MPLGWVLAEKWVHLGGFEQSPGLVCVDKNVASPKLYVLEPWIADLLVNYEQLDKRENFLAGQVVRVLSDSTAPGQPGLQEAVVQVSDGSCYIRVVITPEALQAEENAHLQLRLSSLNCRIIVLQKYTVCFQDEARLEDCEFYLTAQQFIVLPMQRQRMESSDGNQDPSVVKKIKELWLRNLAVRNAPSSEPSVSQLIDAIGQNQLEILKENAEECLDLWKSKDKPVTVEDEVPVTQWEAERKKEQGENVFMVPVSALVIPPEEEAVVCDSSEAASAGYTDTSQAAPGKSSDDRTMPGDPSVVSQTSCATSPALSDSLEGSPDNPWDRMPSLSLTPSSSDEKTFQPDPPLKTQKDVAADSNTTDLLELCSQGSPEGLPQGEPVQTSSPSLLRSHSTPSPVEISTTEVASAAEAAWDTLHADRGPQGSRGSQATLPALPPVFPALPGSSIQSLPGRIPHREQACSSGTTSSSDVLRPGLAHSRTQGRETAGAKRKMVEADEQGPSGQQLTLGTSEGRGRGTDKRSELMSPQGAKKSRKQTGLQRGKELEEEEEEDKEEEEEEEEEQASPARAGPSSRPEQCRAPEPFMERPPQYQYEAPSPELCQQVQSIRSVPYQPWTRGCPLFLQGTLHRCSESPVSTLPLVTSCPSGVSTAGFLLTLAPPVWFLRISKAMLKWACWILTEEEDS
uniref:Cyclic nucleotide-gated cation channel beta-1-like n=1 Tax=Cyanistes caeruleus TaxID=156563 RepID=A0A8C0Z969_CYACU